MLSKKKKKNYSMASLLEIVSKIKFFFFLNDAWLIFMASKLSLDFFFLNLWVLAKLHI